MTTTSPARSDRTAADRATAALAVGTHLLTGSYRADPVAGWSWSGEVDAMLGGKPGSLEPGPEALDARLHPDERDRVVLDAGRLLAAGGPVTTARRVVDSHGRTRTLLVTAQARRHHEDGRAPEVAGYVVDVTPVQREAVQRDVRRALDAAFVATAAIERAKGVLMAVHGVSEAEAESLLTEAAGATGATLRDAATQMMAHLSEADGFGRRAKEGVRDALATVQPARRPHVHEAQLARRRVA